MKTARYFILTLFIFLTFAFLPDGFAQTHRPMVRLIYFLPNDRQPRQNMDTEMAALIKDVQQIYADEMERHGFGRKTFHIETDRTGKAVVHRFNGQFADAYYQEDYWGRVWDEISQRFDLSKDFYVISIETRNESLCGLGAAYGSGGGVIMIPSSGLCFESTGAATHELGHAFRLDHDFRNDLYHMSYGKDWEKNQFSPCAAKWLDAHRAFNEAQAAVDEPATVKMLPQSIEPSSNAMRLRFQVTDPNGLHQVQLKSDTTDEDSAPGTKLIDCKSLSGDSLTVEFVTTGLTPQNKRVYLAVMDVRGNFEQYEFPINVPIQVEPPTTEVRVDASVDVLIYTGRVSWITRPAAITEAQTTKRLLQSAGIQAEITDNENTVKQWMLQTASDGSVDVLILYGPIPATIYPPKNAMPEGSVAENWIETPDGNTILNHADYFGFTSTDQRQRNGAATLQNLMDIPGIFIPTDRFNIPMFVTGQGRAVTPSLVNFQSDRAFPLNQLQGEWFAEKIFASNTGAVEATLADPVIVRDGNRGRIAIAHQTYLEDNPKGEVAAEMIINYLLYDAPAPAQTVNIPDANLRTKIERALGKAPGATITTADMATLTGLNAINANISDLTGIEYATNLTALLLRDNNIVDISVVAGLTNLTVLRSGNNSISDISPLAGLTNLTELSLYGNSISNISVLAGLTNLAHLGLGSNNIVDISSVSRLTNLTYLSLGRNNITDISSVSRLTNLTSLLLDNNNVTNISGLSGLTNLPQLWLSHNTLSDISPLSDLTNLTNLWLRGNNIPDLSPLVSNTGLGQDDEVDVRGNPLNADAYNTHIPTLQRRGVEVHFDAVVAQTVNIPDPNLRTKIEQALGKASGATITTADMATLTRLDAGESNISDLTGLDGATNLTELFLHGNNISNISTVADLINLTELWLNHNSISDISALNDLTNLTGLLLNGNNISNISALAGLTYLTDLILDNNTITDISALSGLTNLTMLWLWDNNITDISPLVSNTGLGRGDGVSVTKNPLNAASINTHIPTLKRRGVDVQFDAPPPVTIPDPNLRAAIESALGKTSDATITTADMATLTGLDASDTNISDLAGLEHATNLTWMQLQDNSVSNLSPLAGLTDLTSLWLGRNSVSDLSALTGLTNLIGLWLENNAITDLSPLVSNTGLGGGDEIDVRGNPLNADAYNTHIPDLESRGVDVQFDIKPTSTDTPAQVKGDVNGDGVVNIQDLVLTARRFGQQGQNDADMNEDGVVNIQDLVLVARAFGNAGAAPALHSKALTTLTAADVQGWLTEAAQTGLKTPAHLRGIAVLEQLLSALTPEETTLLPNYPNPFNPETWIPYHLANASDVWISIYDINGALVRQLDLGYQPAGYYTERGRAAYWDGANERGETVASGVYFYTLTTNKFTSTRRMLILK